MILDTCKLDDFTLKCETISDGREFPIASHEAVYADGAVLESMGASAPTFTIKAWFFDKDYQDYLDFISYTSRYTKDGYDLHHPVLGDMHGQIKSIAAHNEAEYINTKTVDITFIKEGDTAWTPSATVVNAVADKVLQDWSDGQNEIMDAAAADVTDAIGTEASDILAAIINTTQDIANQFIDVTMSARTKLQAIDTGIANAQNALLSLTVGIDEAVSIFEYPSTIPGRIASVLGSVCAGYANTLSGLIGSPAEFISNLSNIYGCFIDSYNDDVDGYFPFKTYVKTACAQSLALYAAERYTEDADLGASVRQAETAAAFDVAGNWLNPPQTPVVMTIDQLEQSLATVRSLLQTAVTGTRDIPSLKTMALDLLQHVDSVRLTREKILTVTVDTEMPLLLLLHNNGLPYTYSQRIMSINPAIENPMFVIGEVRLYAN